MNKEITTGVLFTRNYANMTVVNDTVMRVNDETATVNPHIFFYYNGGKPYNESFNHVAIYTTEGDTYTKEDSGFLSGDNCYVNSSNGYVYNAANGEILGHPAWSAQIINYNDTEYLLFLSMASGIVNEYELFEGGIYLCNVTNTNTELDFQRIGDIVLMNNSIHYCGDGKILIRDYGRSVNEGGTGLNGLVSVDFSGTVSSDSFDLLLADSAINDGVTDAALKADVHSMGMYNGQVIYLDSNFTLNAVTGTAGKTKLADSAMQFYVKDNYIYYINSENGGLIRYPE